MGACTFITSAKGKTAREAFIAAVDEAAYENGHGGYTGTIAEKNAFTMIALPTGREAVEYAQGLLDTDDKRISKWGPAGCIALGGDEYLFFGWASS